ncbi:MAG: hypothetical protein QY326_10130 [Bdellovibrionota bacterium]|nr:MAG: hypothetical protein QY326_10130 [Bdellovibrionota bacterium]
MGIAVAAVALTVGGSASQSPNLDSREAHTQLSSVNLPDSVNKATFVPTRMDPHAYFVLNGKFPAPDPERPFTTFYLNRFEMAALLPDRAETLPTMPEGGSVEVPSADPNRPLHTEFLSKSQLQGLPVFEGSQESNKKE